MGIGALLILLCHSVGNNVTMPYFLEKIAIQGNIGVDIFLFLSGLGLSYSLNKTTSNCQICNYRKGMISWYIKRYLRILLPYYILTIPYLIYKMQFSSMSLAQGLSSLLTFEYWEYGSGAWFISLIVILYAVAPLLYRILNNSKQKWIACYTICIFLMFICADTNPKPSVLNNIYLAFQRVPSFIVGMSIANNVKNNKSINALVFIPIVLYSLFSYIFPVCYTKWLIVLPLTLLLSLLLSIFNYLRIISAFFGMISLESYLTNIYLGDIFNHKSWIVFGTDLSYGHYIEYLSVLIAGIFIAFIFNEISEKLFRTTNLFFFYK